MSQIRHFSRQFDKPPLMVSEQVNLLKSRGLIFPNRDIAEHFLLHCNYYRFSGYALHFEIFKDRQRTHTFKPNTTFENVKELYEFDDKLRSILFDYIGHIEISIRSTMCNVIALRTKSSHWYLDPNLFCAKFHSKNKQGFSEYDFFLKTVESESFRSREIFIKSYKDSYSAPVQPPSWMIIEILTMSNWSKLYQNLKREEYKKDIAEIFGLNQSVFVSWIRALSVLRNHCAHHSRIWNKRFHLSPKVPRRIKPELDMLPPEGDDYSYLVSFFIAINALLDVLNRKEQFQEEMKELFNNFPGISLKSMNLSKERLEWLGYR